MNQTEDDDGDERLPRAVLYREYPSLHDANQSSSRRDARIIAVAFALFDGGALAHLYGWQGEGTKTLLFLAQQLISPGSGSNRQSYCGWHRLTPNDCNVSLNPRRVKRRKDCVTRFHND